jgi:uncharacterized membrane protein YraQ (UPF0718 family)
LKKQGANNGASLAFLISTPESGVDSIALTYSLLDPIMTVLRPMAAFVTGIVAGTIENFTGGSYAESSQGNPDKRCLVDGCCDGEDCGPEEHARHHTLWEKLSAGLSFAFDELLTDLAKWFLLGVLLAGVITYVVPESLFEGDLASGAAAYVGALLISLPMYVCATLSTPLAAALVMKGLSPGAALVFLIAGPATNVATITMLGGIFGRRTLLIYLGSIVVCTLLFGYLADLLYSGLGISAKAAAGAAGGEIFPSSLESIAAVVLAALCLRATAAPWLKKLRPKGARRAPADPALPACESNDPACCDQAAEPGGT